MRPSIRRPCAYLGTHSGRDSYKATHVGFTPAYLDGSVAFEQASLVLVCRKLYADDIKPEKFLDGSIDARCYPEKDYHTMYIAEVEHALVSA